MATIEIDGEALDEITGDKRTKIIHPLAHADERDGHLPFPPGLRCRDGGNDPALGRTIELGQDETGQADRLVEGVELGQPVLPGVGIQHQPHGVRGGWICLGDDPPDLLQLFHEMGLGWKSTGGIGKDDVHLPRACGLNRIKYDRGRVTALLCDHRDIVPLPPDSQLLPGGRPERIPRGEQNTQALVAKIVRDLADGGRLPGTIDAGHQDHKGTRPPGIDRDLERLKELHQEVGKR